MKTVSELSDDILSTRLNFPIIHEIQDVTLKNLIIYGPDYGKNFSLNHVQLIGQGNPVLKSQGSNVFNLTFSSHCSYSGDINKFIGDYTPILAAIYSSGRSFEYAGKRYQNIRMGVFPKIKVVFKSGAGIVIP